MDHSQVIETMQREGGFASGEEAEAGLRAALGALADRVSAGSAAAVAEALPGDLQGALRSASAQAGGGTGADVGQDVARRLSLPDEAAGVNVVAAAMRTLATAVDDPERIRAFRDQLPSDLRRMLLQESEGDTSAVHSSVEAQRTR